MKTAVNRQVRGGAKVSQRACKIYAEISCRFLYYLVDLHRCFDVTSSMFTVRFTRL